MVRFCPNNEQTVLRSHNQLGKLLTPQPPAIRPLPEARAARLRHRPEVRPSVQITVPEEHARGKRRESVNNSLSVWAQRCPRAQIRSNYQTRTCRRDSDFSPVPGPAQGGSSLRGERRPPRWVSGGGGEMVAPQGSCPGCFSSCRISRPGVRVGDTVFACSSQGLRGLHRLQVWVLHPGGRQGGTAWLLWGGPHRSSPRTEAFASTVFFRFPQTVYNLPFSKGCLSGEAPGDGVSGSDCKTCVQYRKFGKGRRKPDREVLPAAGEPSPSRRSLEVGGGGGRGAWLL